MRPHLSPSQAERVSRGECAAPGCGEAIPQGAGRIYCAHRCQQRGYKERLAEGLVIPQAERNRAHWRATAARLRELAAHSHGKGLGLLQHARKLRDAATRLDRRAAGQLELELELGKG